MGLKSFMGKLDKAYQGQKAAAEKRAEANLTHAKTKTARDKVLMGLREEKAEARVKLETARAKALKAVAASKAAEREVAQYGLGASLMRGLVSLRGSPKQATHRRRKGSKR